MLPPEGQEEQQNIWEFEDMVPEFPLDVSGSAEPLTEEPLPSTSYRIRWNERSESWTADWFDEDGNPIDQGRRLSTNWTLRTTWGNGFLPDPMPAWIFFFDLGETKAEAGFEDLGRSHQLIELDLDEVAEIPGAPNLATQLGVTVSIP